MEGTCEYTSVEATCEYMSVEGTVPIIKKLTFSFGRPSVPGRLCTGALMKHPCQRMGRPHSTDNEYD